VINLTRVPYVITNRSLDTLQRTTFGEMFDISKLAGKRVLDAGSGESSFVKELRNKRIDAYSIDMADIKPENTNTHIRGLIDKMPFANEVFDYVFSAWSLFYYPEEAALHIKGLKEICRVLKPKGKLIAAPVDESLFHRRLNDSGVPMKITDSMQVDEMLDTYQDCLEITKLK